MVVVGFRGGTFKRIFMFSAANRRRLIGFRRHCFFRSFLWYAVAVLRSSRRKGFRRGAEDGITEKIVSVLKNRGIENLFPIEMQEFRKVMDLKPFKLDIDDLLHEFAEVDQLLWLNSKGSGLQRNSNLYLRLALPLTMVSLCSHCMHIPLVRLIYMFLNQFSALFSTGFSLHLEASFEIWWTSSFGQQISEALYVLQITKVLGDQEFAAADPAIEEIIKPSCKHNIELSITKVGTLVWEERVVGWDVSYGAEFVPSIVGGYTFIVQKATKIGPSDEQIISFSFKNGETGKIVLTFDNLTSKKKKLIYRWLSAIGEKPELNNFLAYKNVSSTGRIAAGVAAAAVVAPAPTKPLKKGKREAEVVIEKELKVVKKKVESSSDDSDISSESEEKPKIRRLVSTFGDIARSFFSFFNLDLQTLRGTKRRNNHLLVGVDRKLAVIAVSLLPLCAAIQGLSPFVELRSHRSVSVTDTAKLILWNKASEKLRGEPTQDVIALYGDTARIMPDDIAEKILGREGLFELVVSSEGLHVDGFNVSRLTIDDEIKDVYIMRNYPAANPEYDSFSETLDYVEIEDRASNNNVQTGAPKDATAEVDSEPTHTSKRQKRE
ncbi:hypothetical protein CASFOL_035620 [Castilleja foliolosa]|uniref:GOLD domain-containing protein n=1 Tax=Castilleja foliolosa TaxID=1961234 RepID=A0ABD3BTC1_9LAMI